MKVLKSELLWVFLVIVLSFGISLNLFRNEILQGKNIPADKFQTFEHNFLPDFNVYLSKMTEGAKGEVLVYERMTSDPHEPSLLQIFYLVIGKIGIGIMGLRADIAYNFWRFVLSLVWTFTGYIFIRTIFSGEEKKIFRILAFALFVFSGSFPFKVVNPNEFGVLIFGQKYRIMMENWSYMDPLQRITFIPHWEAGHILMALQLILLLRWRLFEGVGTKIRIGLIGIIGLISGLILPPTQIVIYVLWGMFIMTLLVTGHLKKAFRSFIYLSIFGIVSGLSLLYIKWVTGFYPWKSLTIADASPYILHFPWKEYFQGLGVTGYLGIIGIVCFIGLILKRGYLNKNWSLLVPIFWVLGAFLLIFAYDNLLHFDQRRFVQVGAELPLAIMTVYFINLITNIFRKLKNYLLIIISLIILIPSVFVWYISYVSRETFVRDRLYASMPLISYTPFVVYEPRDWMEGVFWLEKNSSANDVVFCDYVCGNFVAAYAGNRVYAGHGAQTPDFGLRVGLIKDFFSGNMKERQAELFLNKNYVKYVFTGPQEMEYGGGFLKYKFLTSVYKGPTTTIYKIK